MSNPTAPMEGERNLQVSIFGKPDCALCKSAQRKVEFFLGKWNLTERVALHFHDMTTVEGLSESAYHDATDVPSTLVFANGRVVARWGLTIPTSDELRQALTQPHLIEGEAPGS